MGSSYMSSSGSSLYIKEKWKLSRKEGDSKSMKSCASSFSTKCASLVKQQRARFYIMRRCLVMLACWRDS